MTIIRHFASYKIHFCNKMHYILQIYKLKKTNFTMYFKGALQSVLRTPMSLFIG